MRNSKNVYSHSWQLAENYGTFTLSYKQDKIRSIIAKHMFILTCFLLKTIISIITHFEKHFLANSDLYTL